MTSSVTLLMFAWLCSAKLRRGAQQQDRQLLDSCYCDVALDYAYLPSTSAVLGAQYKLLGACLPDIPARRHRISLLVANYRYLLVRQQSGSQTLMLNQLFATTLSKNLYLRAIAG